jgi:hypothetical protein
MTDKKRPLSSRQPAEPDDKVQVPDIMVSLTPEAMREIADRIEAEERDKLQRGVGPGDPVHVDEYGRIKAVIPGHDVDQEVYAPIDFELFWIGDRSISLSQEDQDRAGKKFTAMIQISMQQARRLRELLDMALQNSTGE